MACHFIQQLGSTSPTGTFEKYVPGQCGWAGQSRASSVYEPQRDYLKSTQTQQKAVISSYPLGKHSVSAPLRSGRNMAQSLYALKTVPQYQLSPNQTILRPLGRDPGSNTDDPTMPASWTPDPGPDPVNHWVGSLCFPAPSIGATFLPASSRWF
ncbi:hypothetical protein HRR86_003888 [Exophiala dermatitidis]|nr:hypothetical protein HRR82_003794 [Exophiala dermatitidis]KAJ4627687.1 hypothetical protein HRR86_003888 [Exophiala dermatitidis]